MSSKKFILKVFDSNQISQEKDLVKKIKDLVKLKYDKLNWHCEDDLDQYSTIFALCYQKTDQDGNKELVPVITSRITHKYQDANKNMILPLQEDFPELEIPENAVEITRTAAMSKKTREELKLSKIKYQFYNSLMYCAIFQYAKQINSVIYFLAVPSFIDKYVKNRSVKVERIGKPKRIPQYNNDIHEVANMKINHSFIFNVILRISQWFSII